MRLVRMLPVLAVLGALLAAPAPAPASAASPVSVVSLGDSYTSGNGALDPYGPPDCSRSYGSYPWRYVTALRTEGIDADLHHLACAGATNADVAGPRGQLDAARREAPSADLVLLTIGGNDFGFSSVVSSCLFGLTFAGSCDDLLASATARFQSVIDVDTAATLRAVGAAYDHAQVVLLGYPHLTDPPCGTAYDARLDDLQASVDREQAAVVDRLNADGGTARFHYVDVRAAFAGHGPCAPPAARFVNNLTVPFSATFHPNPAGNQVEADLLLAAGLAGGAPDARGSTVDGWYVTPRGTRRPLAAGASACLRALGAVPVTRADPLAAETSAVSCAPDRLAVDGVLHRGGRLVSTDGRYRLELQASDGNLVLYGPSGRALWARPAPAAQHLVLQVDGNVVAYAFGWVPPALWSTGTSGTGADQLVLQDDGNLVLYAPGPRAVWSTGTYGRE